MSVQLPKHANDTKICIGLFVAMFSMILCAVCLFGAPFFVMQIGVAKALMLPVGFALLAVLAHVVVRKLERKG